MSNTGIPNQDPNSLPMGNYPQIYQPMYAVPYFPSPQPMYSIPYGQIYSADAMAQSIGYSQQPRPRPPVLDRTKKLLAIRRPDGADVITQQLQQQQQQQQQQQLILQQQQFQRVPDPEQSQGEPLLPAHIVPQVGTVTLQSSSPAPPLRVETKLAVAEEPHRFVTEFRNKISTHRPPASASEYKSSPPTYTTIPAEAFPMVVGKTVEAPAAVPSAPFPHQDDTAVESQPPSIDQGFAAAAAAAANPDHAEVQPVADQYHAEVTTEFAVPTVASCGESKEGPVFVENADLDKDIGMTVFYGDDVVHLDPLSQEEPRGEDEEQVVAPVSATCVESSPGQVDYMEAVGAASDDDTAAAPTKKQNGTVEVKQQNIFSSLDSESIARNNSAMKVYSREELMQIQNQFNQTERPRWLFRVDFDELVKPDSNRGGGPGAGNAPYPGRQSRSNVMRNRPALIKHVPETSNLNRSENPYSIASVDAIDHTEKLRKQVRSILNKITHENFDMLYGELIAFDIGSKDNLQVVIDLIFNKVLVEPMFCEIYAKLCEKLINGAERDENSRKSFRKLLIFSSQREFETDRVEEALLEKDITSQGDKKMSDEMEERMQKFRRRKLGNMRFVGELCKRKLLSPNVVENCINKLLNTHDDESLECMSKLMTTVGKEFETSRKAVMDKMMSSIQSIISERKVSSRIRFMLQDLVDLQRRGWAQTKDASKKPALLEPKLVPTKLDSSSMSSSQSVRAEPRQNVRGDRGDNQGYHDRSRPTYNRTSARPPSSKQQSVFPTLGSSATSSTDKTSLYPSWKQTSVPQKPADLSNRFTALSDSVEVVNISGAAPSSELTVQGLQAASTTPSTSCNSSRAPSPDSKSAADGESTVVDVGTRTKNVLKAYLQQKNPEDAIYFFEQLESDSVQQDALLGLLNVYVDCACKERPLVQQLSVAILGQHPQLKGPFISALGLLLGSVDDLVVDIPMVFTYIGDLVRAMTVISGVLSLRDLTKLVAVCPRFAGILEGAEKESAILQETNACTPETEVASEEGTRSSSLDKLMNDLDVPNSELVAQLENMMQDTPVTRELVHSLVCTLCSGGQAGRLWVERLQARSGLLSKFVQHDSTLQLEILALLHKLSLSADYAPPGLLQACYETLWRTGVVATNVMLGWLQQNGDKASNAVTRAFLESLSGHTLTS